MGKRISQSQWLNIVIIVISALVLAFTLIGQFMHQAVDESDASKIVAANDSLQVSVPTIQLTSIDFGTLRISREQQKNQSKLAFSWSVLPKGGLTQQQIKLLVDRWQKILTTPVNPLEQSASINYSPIATVLLYFEETAQPIIAKVEMGDKIETTPLINIRFVSTGQQITIDNLQLDHLLPLQVLQKSSGETKPTKATDLSGLN